MTDALPFEVHPILAWPLYKTNIGRKFTKQEQDVFDTIIDKGLEPRISTRPKRISMDKYVLNQKPLASVQSFIDQHLKQFTIDILGLTNSNVSCDITTSWLNMYEGQEFKDLAEPHQHLNSIITGIFYPKCLELSGDETDGIVLMGKQENSIFQNFLIGGLKPTSFSGSKMFCSLVDGDLIMFPSIVQHAVLKNQTDQTRISLAFNTFVFGELGNTGTTSELIFKQKKYD